MMGKEGYALLVVVTCVALLPRCHLQGEEETIQII